jgi:PAS domain S-box-containing protein
MSLCDTHGSDDVSHEERPTDPYRLLLEGPRAIPWRLDWTSKAFTYVGPQIEAILGWEPAAWAGVQDWVDSIHVEDRERVVSLCVAQSEQGVDHYADYRAKRSDGSYLWVRDVVHVVRKDGVTESLIGLIFDISDKKKSEEDLAAAKTATEAAARAKSDFFANMAHEVRTPLNGVLGMTHALAATPLDDRQARMVQIISDAGAALLRSVNDVLDFAKIEAGGSSSKRSSSRPVRWRRASSPSSSRRRRKRASCSASRSSRRGRMRGSAIRRGSVRSFRISWRTP